MKNLKRKRIIHNLMKIYNIKDNSQLTLKIQTNSYKNDIKIKTINQKWNLLK